HVTLQLRRRLRTGRLVVDQLVRLTRPLGEAIDAVDAPAQVVGPDSERELPLEPHRLGALGVQPSVVARERLPCPLPEPKLASAFAKATSSPPRVEQAEQLRKRPSALGVVALEHLVDRDPESLLKRLLGRDPQDARELVPQRAAEVGRYVGGRESDSDS